MLDFRLFSALVLGLLFGLGYGGYDALKHYTLRRMLARDGLLPFHDKDLVSFLDYSVERIVLRRVVAATSLSIAC